MKLLECPNYPVIKIEIDFNKNILPNIASIAEFTKATTLKNRSYFFPATINIVGNIKIHIKIPPNIPVITSIVCN